MHHRKKKKKSFKHSGISLGVLGTASIGLLLNGIGHIPLTTAQGLDSNKIMEEIQTDTYINTQNDNIQYTQGKVAEDIIVIEKISELPPTS